MGFIPIPLGVVIIKVLTRCVSIDGQLVSIVLLLSTLTCVATLKIINLAYIIGRACKMINLDKTVCENKNKNKNKSQLFIYFYIIINRLIYGRHALIHKY